MGHKKNKGKSKRGKSNKRVEQNNQENIYQKEEEYSKNIADAVYDETVLQDNKEDASDIHTDASASETQSKAGTETTTDNTGSSTDKGTTNTDTATKSNTTDMNDCCEEIKEKQQELFNKLKNLSESLVALTIIRDDVNSLRVDTLTELYFTRQVRPLLDALNIISFASTNMSSTATAVQLNAFGETKEIKNALKLTYKMNDEVDDIIDTLGRRLKIFLDEIDNIDRKCPPFNFGKDS